MKRVLIACEESGTVRDAFTKLGFDATSCDFQPTRTLGSHYQGDVFDIIGQGWDLMIAHPPCTFLSVSGASWFYHPEDKDLPVKERRPHPRYPTRLQDQKDASDFFIKLATASVPRIAVENPIGRMSRFYGKPDQIIQPWMFGDEASKATCLWLKNLPKLTPTKIVGKGDFTITKSGKKMATWYYDCVSLPKAERQKLRSKTFQGIADAMADQWGKLL